MRSIHILGIKTRQTTKDKKVGNISFI